MEESRNIDLLHATIDNFLLRSDNLIMKVDYVFKELPRKFPRDEWVPIQQVIELISRKICFMYHLLPCYHIGLAAVWARDHLRCADRSHPGHRAVGLNRREELPSAHKGRKLLCMPRGDPRRPEGRIPLAGELHLGGEGDILCVEKLKVSPPDIFVLVCFDL